LAAGASKQFRRVAPYFGHRGICASAMSPLSLDARHDVVQTATTPQQSQQTHFIPIFSRLPNLISQYFQHIFHSFEFDLMEKSAITALTAIKVIVCEMTC